METARDAAEGSVARHAGRQYQWSFGKLVTMGTVDKSVCDSHELEMDF
jgi:hypothetical protein